MTELEELEDIVGSLESIEPFGIEPDFSSLGLEPAEVLGFQTEEELENVINLLTIVQIHYIFVSKCIYGCIKVFFFVDISDF